MKSVMAVSYSTGSVLPSTSLLIILVLISIIDCSGPSYVGNRVNILDWEQDPTFDTRLPRNITVAVGQTAPLRCRVFSLGNKTVSWLRHDTMHILSAGMYTYISNTRFLAKYQEVEDIWQLNIRQVEEDDAGVYECQVSTLPVISFFVNLNVVEPHTEILGDEDLYVQTGSSLNITCIINYLPQDEDTIRWIHQDRVLTYDTPNKDISIFTTKGEISVSSLVIRKLTRSDTGRYMCAPGSIKPAAINVHVLEGELTSQLHTETGTSLLIPIISLTIVSSFILFLGTIRTIYQYRNQPPTVTE